MQKAKRQALVKLFRIGAAKSGNRPVQEIIDECSARVILGTRFDGSPTDAIVRFRNSKFNNHRASNADSREMAKLDLVFTYWRWHPQRSDVFAS